GCGDDFIVADAATRLNHAACACVDHYVQAVTEGEEFVRRNGRPGQRETRILGLDGGDACRIDTTHLAGTHAERHAVANENDRIRLHELGDFPGELEIFHLFFRWLNICYHAEFSIWCQEIVRILHQPAAAYAFNVKGIPAVAQWNLQHADVLLGCENSHGLRGVFRGQHHFNKLLADCFGCCAI